MKKWCARLGAAMTVAVSSVSVAFASMESSFNTVVAPVVELINSLVNPFLAVVGAVGALYCIVLGVKYARAEEPQEREKAKGSLKNAVIGFILIFVLLVILKLLMPVMQNWVK